jgi:hypothetical protein
MLGERVSEAGLIRLPDVDDPQVWAFAWVDVDRPPEPELVVASIFKILEHVSWHIAKHGDRAARLIGIPLPGPRHGGLETRRSEVIERFLDGYRSTSLDADLALVLVDRRDFAAVQEPRTDGLGRAHERACRGSPPTGKIGGKRRTLAVLGRGVSRPVGLPDWRGLLESLAADAGDNAPTLAGDPYKIAEPIGMLLSNGYHDALRRHLLRHTYGINHALLASLGAKRMVTTNFERCMEIALEAPTSSEFRVLARELTRGGWPWLLKLNGDITDPATVVLTESDLSRHPEERQVLEGGVQSLLLTRHLLFAGFSLTDENFLELASAVSRVRSRAQDQDSSMPGTALALTDDECKRAKYTDLHMLSMDTRDPAKGALTLQVFLDRLVWRAATQGRLASEYLLDGRYESGLPEHDAALRKLLVKVLTEASEHARSSSAWSLVVEFLSDLGADESRLL